MTTNKFLKGIEWFVLLHPVLDFLTSLMVRFVDLPLTLGMILRILFVGITLVYLAFFYNGKHKKTILIYLGALVVYGLISIGSNAYFNGLSSVFTNAKMFFKSFYFVFVLAFFYALYQQEGFRIKNKVLAIVFLEYAASIILSALTNTSFVTYKYAEGFVGWFYAASEVGPVIAMLAVPALLLFIQSDRWYWKALIALSICFPATYLGTKVPFIAVLGAVALLAVMVILKTLLQKGHKKRWTAPVAMLLLIVLFIGLYQFDSPIKVNNSAMVDYHYDSNVTENLDETKPSVQTPAPQPTPTPAPEPDSAPTPEPAPQPEPKPTPAPDSEKTEIPSPSEVLKGKSKAYLVLNWLLSDRLYYFDGAITAFGESSLYRQAFGLGHQFQFADGRTLIEMDFMALLINQGYLGLAFVLLPILAFAIICIKRFFQQIRNFLQMTDCVLYAYAVLMGLFSAFLAGHVLVAPAVSIYVALLIVNLYAMLKEREQLQ